MLVRWSDHDAAYVDVSNEEATAWGQAGWWLGTSGTGELFTAPVGYVEYRLADGTYIWRSIGPPPPNATYSVEGTGQMVHDAQGHPVPLYRIDASFVAGRLATFPYPATAGYNAGLAESYSTGGFLEPLGPTSYARIHLLDGTHWGLWTKRLDSASRSAGAGDSVALGAPWHRWSVEGHLRYGPTAFPPWLFALAPTAAAPAPPPWSAASAGWRLSAPAALRTADLVSVGAIGADASGRLVGTALDRAGRMLAWRWRVDRPDAPVERWPLGDLRARMGDGQAEGWVALAGGSAAYVSGRVLVWLPPGLGPARIADLGDGGGDALAQAAGPDGTLAIVRSDPPGLELWRPGPAGARRVARLRWPMSVALPDAIAAEPGGHSWLADDPGADGAGGAAYARIRRIVLAAGPRGEGVLVRTGEWNAPARRLAAGAGVWAAAGGDGAHGVLVALAGSSPHHLAPLAAADNWTDAIALSRDAIVWSTARQGRSTWLDAATPSGGRRVRLRLPPLWVAEAPARTLRNAPGALAQASSPPYAVHLAAGPGWVAAAPLDQSVVYVATRIPTPSPRHP